METLPLYTLLVSVLLLLLFPGALMLSIFAVSAARKARKLKRSAYDRLGFQLTRLGVWMGLAACLILLGSVLVDGVRLDMFRDGVMSFFANGLHIFALGLVLLNSVLLVWCRSVSHYRVCTVIFFLPTLLFVLFSLGVVIVGFSGEYDGEIWSVLQGHPINFFELALWGMQGYTLQYGLTLAIGACGGLAAAGVMALLFLLARRGADDFGRDYYQLAMPWCALRAAIGTAGLLLIYGIALAAESTLPRLEARAIFAWGGLVAGLIAFIGWCMVAKSASPMRLKAVILISFILFLVFFFTPGMWMGG